jgi:PAS domain S-box-containing protein
MNELKKFGAASTRALLELLDDGIVFHDPDGVVVTCNEAAQRILGLDAGELVGSASLFPHVEAFDAAEHRLTSGAEPVWEALAYRRRTAPVAVRFRRSGADAWVELSSVPVVRSGVGDLRGAVTRIEDVGARRASERETHGRQRMEILGRLAGSVAHDFNNLLTVILGYDSMLLAQLDPASHEWHDANEVRKAAERGAELSRQLLAIGRGQAIEWRSLDLKEVLAQAAPMLAQVAGRHVEVRIETAAHVVPVRADQGQLDQVLLNLVLNARDAMPHGGAIAVRATTEELDAAFVESHPGSRPGPHALLEVVDPGIGMDAETLARMFEPFFTTKAHEHGTGLGLATVYGIVKQHRGYIGVESAPGRGSRFRIWLPLLAEPPAAEGAEAPRVTRADGAPFVLLAVEDAQLRELSKAVLERGGYRVSAESDGAVALALAKEHDGPLAGLITDVALPGLSGVELARGVMAMRPETTVLFLSGYSDDATDTATLPVRELHLLAKPFPPEALLEKLHDLLARPGLARAAPPRA